MAGDEEKQLLIPADEDEEELTSPELVSTHEIHKLNDAENIELVPASKTNTEVPSENAEVPLDNAEVPRDNTAVAPEILYVNTQSELAQTEKTELETPGSSTQPAPETPATSTQPESEIPGSSTQPEPETPATSTHPEPEAPGASTEHYTEPDDDLEAQILPDNAADDILIEIPIVDTDTDQVGQLLPPKSQQPKWGNSEKSTKQYGQDECTKLLHTPSITSERPSCYGGMLD